MLVYVVIVDLLSIITLDLKVWEDHGQVDNAACDRVQRQIHFFVFKFILAQ